MVLIIYDPSQCPPGCDCYTCESERYADYMAQLEAERVKYTPRFKGIRPPYGRRKFDYGRDLSFAYSPNRYRGK